MRTFTIRWLWGILLLFYSCIGVRAQCGNSDFENGDFTGWTASSGCYQNGVINVPNTGVNGTRHQITSGTGFDPLVSTIPVVSPFGGNYSVQLGNSAVGWGAERLSYTFMVDPNNALFTYQYAVVFQDPTNGNHDDDVRPSLDVQIRDGITGDTITCGYYHVVSRANLDGYQYGGTFTGQTANATNGCNATTATANQDVWFKNWTLVAIDLTPYIGTTITAEFTTTDCGLGGHFGYAYLDSYCGPLVIRGRFCPGDRDITLSAPPGFSGYLWSTGETTQTIIVPNPVEGDTATVICYPFQGGASCATTLYFPFEQSPTVEVDFDVDALCGRENAQLVDASAVASSGGTINYWQWFVDGILVDTSSNLQYTFDQVGDHTITLISASENGCPDTLTRSVTVPPGLVAAIGIPDGYGVTCFDSEDGYAAIHILSGNPPYVFDWNNGTYNTDSIFNLAPGQYTVIITDSADCQILDTVVITAPPPIRIAPVIRDAVCNNEASGSIRLNTTGGVPPYTFTWAYNTEINSDSIFGLLAGTYDFTITDSKGCVFDSTIVISQPPPIQVTHTYNDVTCYGGSDGSVSITNVTGNTPPYTYLWNTAPPQATLSIQNVPFGSYSCSITDVNNCVVVFTQLVSQPPQLRLELPKTNVRCFGESSGSVTAVPFGGVPGYTFAWSTGSTAGAIPNIPIGFYSCTLTDSHLCTVTQTVEITQPPLLVASASSYDERCFGGNTARAYANVSGGTLPYYYVWSTSPLQQQLVALNLEVGTYTVTVTDGHACTTTANTTINEPPQLTVAITDIEHNRCYYGREGAATAVASGGSPAYRYRWNTVPPQTTDAVSQLRASQYQVTVTDDSMCVATASVEITEPTPIVVTRLVADALCFDSAQGSIKLYTSGGTPNYTYNWSPNVSTTDSAENIVAGAYHVTITDANNCTTTQRYFVNQPPKLYISTKGTKPYCNGETGGVITVSGNGGTPDYDYSLWQNNNIVATSSDGVFQNIQAGDYTAQYVDANGCVITEPVLITQPEPLTLQLSADSVNCYDYSDGSITVLAMGGVPPYEYVLNNGSSINSWGLFYGLRQGTYQIRVYDRQRCYIDTVAVVNEPPYVSLLAQPDSLVMNLGETKPIVLSSNNSTIQYQWFPTDGLDCTTCETANVTLYNNSFYRVQGTTHPHDLDCVVEVIVPVTVIPDYAVYIPNAFTPNNNGANDYYEIFGKKHIWLEMRFRIFNRWGEKVFESGDPSFKWDGTFKGIPLNPGVFVYDFELTFVDGHSITPQKGSITLIR